MAEHDHRPDLRLAGGLTVAVVVPLVGLAVWAMSVADRLPEPVARHWGAGGQADGFSSLTATLWMAVVVVAVVAVPLGVVAVLARQPVAFRRSLAGAAAGIAVFVTVVVADSLRGQLDLADPSLAPGPGIGLGVGTALGVLVGIAVAALARERESAVRAATTPPPSRAGRLRGGAPAVIETTLPGLDTAARVLAVVSGVLLLAMSAAMSWWLAPMAALVSGLLLGAGRIRCRVDLDGLTATALGRRVLQVPVDEVVEADVVALDPFWEFGGWGLRIDVTGRIGLVTRRGPALRIRRGDDSQVLVTLDEAEEAAALLNSGADAHHAGR